AMREEQIPLAVGASVHNLDGARFQACVEQLTAIRLNEVEVQRGADRGMARSSLRKEQHGVFCSHRIGVVHLAEQFARIRKLRLETGEDFFADRVATYAVTGANRGHQIFRAGAELQTHAPDSSLDDALHRSSPARMKGRNGAAFAI